MAKKAKRVYIIKGSEDGNLGVAGSTELAFNVSMEYLEEHIGHYMELVRTKEDGTGEFYKVDATLENVKAEMLKSKRVTISVEDSSTTVDIDSFILNRF